ncbi:Sugar (and other) transporter [Geosmithia morbida]|uniref:Sugar (And other) transporter n=1 Tax=Geosmithia morbida TaxID=1094350 RepID=A0A9P4Z3C4_9HYPO|nr:Sugar (and other) transporter [Geosmithia morbida]KAF4126478.1 Sugar (and other) transporter [Geosmithia morbida]
MDKLVAKTQYFNRRLAVACSVIAVSTFNYGFDNQAFATTQAMAPFARQFGKYNASTGEYALPASWLSLFGSLNYIGFGVGVMVGSFVSARWGRRMCMFVMSIYALATATVCVTSMHRDQIMAARILNYIYVGMELSVIPNYQAEIVPAPVRGLIVGSYQLSLILGGLVINSICLRTSTLTSNQAWRIPLGLFYIVPSIIAASVWFLPESPRWLLQKGRVDEARENLHKFRVGTLYSEEAIEDELRDIQDQLRREADKGSYVELFSRNNIKRTAIVIGINFFQQATGQQFGSQYGAIYVKQLGTINPFHFTIISSSIAFITICFSLLMTDHIGRRKLLLFSICLMGTAMMTMGGLGTIKDMHKDVKIAIVSMLSLATVSFSTGLGPLCYVVSTEIPALRLRDMTLRTGFVVNVVFNFVSNFIIPYCLDAIGSKTGFIFGSVCILGIAFIYFCVPDCTGKTLEQVDLMFQRGVPIRKFGSYVFEDIDTDSHNDDQVYGKSGVSEPTVVSNNKESSV